MKPRALVLLSGGLDSTTLFHRLHAEGFQLHGLSIDYGQRHRREIDFARRTADHLGATYDVVDLTSVTHLLTTSALTNPSLPIPEGDYEEDRMRQTVVPNRNAMMLATAFGVAQSTGARMVATAVHSGDHALYPDCRREFIERFQEMQDVSLGEHIELHTPYLDLDKTDIAHEAGRLDVPIEETWSCYNGGTVHCGRCGTCVERAWALHQAGVPDPTRYLDNRYWRQVLGKSAPPTS